MLKRIRLTLAIIFWVLITWLLVDFTGTAHAYLGWMAKIQFIPALLALNVGALLFVIALTLLMGRIYCSIICPLGVMQDAIAWFRRKKNKYNYSPERTVLRYTVLVIACASLALGVAWIGGLIFPYSTYGRIVSTILAPLYKLANNGLATIAEHYGSYAFYEVDVWFKSISALVVALLTWGIIAVLAWKGGRTWCNTICPVGTLL
ncbi:MAG: 4Fe-4S binding protein, partial [Bacteroidaceae bacterium]|nr:4Fe-4S binding protein [Bacteroidaceae bacterium]